MFAPPSSAKKSLRPAAGSRTPIRGRLDTENDVRQRARKPALPSTSKGTDTSKKAQSQSDTAARNRTVPGNSRGPRPECRSGILTPRGSEDGGHQTSRNLCEQLDAQCTSSADNVKVVVRVRPVDSDEAHGGFQQLSTTHVSILSAHEHLREHEFDHVCGPKSSQQDIFEVAGRPFMDHCLQGFNVSLFAYGQTSAGKTHTMTGNLSDPGQFGLAPRLLEHLFLQISEAEGREGPDKLKFTVKASYLELYKEVITDLLGPADGASLQLREDLCNGVYVEGLTEQEILNAGDAMAVVEQGSARRRTNETRMNQESSRSHAVLTVYIESWSRADSDVECIRSSRLNLIDLAGSERNTASGATGERLREACSINQSLTTLGRVISELVEAQQAAQAGGAPRHIPYRDSRLTFLLQDSLGGNSKTLIVACVSPAEAHAAETASTLEFAQRAKRIRNRARVNRDTRGDEQLLRREIERLKRDLEARDAAAEPLAQENAELRWQLEAVRAQGFPQQTPGAPTAQQLKEAEKQRKHLEEKCADLEQERDVAERRAAHQEASCSNLKEEVQHARLETLAERKTSAKLRSEMAEASRARVAVEEQLQKLQREADAERAAAQAREAQLQAKLGRLQEEHAEEQLRATKWKSMMEVISSNVNTAYNQAQTPKSESKSGTGRLRLPDLEIESYE